MRRGGFCVHRALSLFLSLLLILTSVSITSFAEGETRSGVVTGDNVNVRSGPGTNHDSIGIQLSTGHAVTVLGEASDSRGGSVPWYQIRFTYNSTEYTGFMRSDYVRIVPEPTPDTPPAETPDTPPAANPDFETQLAAFPEDYKEAIVALHEAHPSWNFIAYDTDLDWNAVQSLENRSGWSFINDGVISHYSTAPGSYDWETDTYVVREGSNWYQAHPAMVAYFMDPRNFLNETDVFQFELLAFSSSQTEETIGQMLRGTFMEGQTLLNNQGETVSYARAFLDAAVSANVSAFHLVARCIQEVGWDGSSCSRGTYPGYEGYYNFFNIGANSGAKDGMIHAKNKGWNTPYKAILAGGDFIGSNYIARGQNTPYYQKYNVVEKNNVASHQYMTNVAAARSEGRIQRNKYVDLRMLENAFTFSIPVYKNMPASPCAAPAPAGSPNNYLKSLEIEGYPLTPTFDFYDCLNNGRTSYSVLIQGDVPSVKVSAVPVSGSATLSGHLGVIPIKTGENTVTVSCTAANGATRNFTVSIVLEGAGSAEGPPAYIPPTPDIPPANPDHPEGTPSGWSPPYPIAGTVLTGIAPGTDTTAFLNSLGLFGNASAGITDENGVVVTGTMRTGLILNYFDGNTMYQYRIVIYGDVNGDSVIDAIDLLLVRKNLLGLVNLSDSAVKACDVNHDGLVDAIDLLLVRKSLLGLTSIQQ